MKIDYEILSTIILPSLLIQEELVTDESMCTKYWLVD